MKDYRYLYGIKPSPMSKQAAFKEDLASYFKELHNGGRPFQKTAKEKQTIVRGLLQKHLAKDKEKCEGGGKQCQGKC